jgi:hypothetical protein
MKLYQQGPERSFSLKKITASIVAAALIGTAGTARAHHSYAMFDITRQATVHGTVKALEWTNPHAWIWVIADSEPDATPYGFEMFSPGELQRFFGFGKTAVAIGDKITISYAPLRSGRRGGAVKAITFADGKVLPLFKGPGPLPAPKAVAP